MTPSMISPLPFLADLYGLDRKGIEALQLSKARRLLARAMANPFYAEGLAATGLTPERLRSLEQWRELPLLDKAAVTADQQADPPYGRRLGVPRGEVRQTHITSGTSGFGQEAFALTGRDLETSGRTWSAPFATAGLVPGEMMVTFYPVTFLTYGRSVMEASRITGVEVTSMAGVERSLALRLMRHLQPAALGCRPALLGLLDLDLSAQGSSPSEAFDNLRAIICSGLAPSQVPVVQERWGATVHEVYGLTQAGGIVATTGPEGAAPDGEAGVMRVLEQHFLVETVDPSTLEPVTEGPAELVLTCLDRIASPVLRYRTRDRVEVVPPDGWGPPVMGLRVGAVGRYDDMCKVRGNNVWPSQLDEALLGAPGVVDYRCEVALDHRSVDVMVVKVRPIPGADAAIDVDDLRKRVKLHTNVTPQVVVDPELPEPGLKPKRLVDLRSTSADAVQTTQGA